MHPANMMGAQFCDRCGTPLVYHYLWAVGEMAAQIPLDTVIEDRYLVTSPQIWLDTQSGLLPDVPTDQLPKMALPYLRLYTHRLHIPILYGFHFQSGQPAVMLLENAPIDPTGRLFPSLDSAWSSVLAVRQVYWLWQMFQLWEPLKQQQVAMSLLKPENLRVEGWRVHLHQLIFDHLEGEQSGNFRARILGKAGLEATEIPQTAPLTEESSEPERLSPSLKDLADVWQSWIEMAHLPVRESLRTITQQMQTTEENEQGMRSIAIQLNCLLLEQAAQVPLKVDLVGATTTGPQRTHNEDACFPNLTEPNSSSNEPLFPYVGIICDGIGGHEGGEVASQLALRSLQLPLRTLLGEFEDPAEPVFPTVVEEQLESIVRVANNVIAEQNDAQRRELRQRMGTTLVMALQLPQQVNTPIGLKNAHELYLAHVGDSRAYWITPHYCHLLTVDDDVTTREVRMGRSLYVEALERPDGGALTQALGTREADVLYPNVQRLIVEENGLLLLCSDGLSDNDRVEQAWQRSTQEIFQGKLSLQQGVQSWIDLANQQNGHDNTSVVLMRFQVGDIPKLPLELPPSASQPVEPDVELTESSRALLYDEIEEPVREPVATQATVAPSAFEKPRKSSKVWLVAIPLAVVMFIAGIVAVGLLRSSSDNSSQPEGYSPGADSNPPSGSPSP